MRSLKIGLLMLGVVVAGNLSAQTDSTEIKLKHYNNLYKQGLIDSAEYSQLKQSILFKEKGKETKPIDYAGLKSKSTGRIVAGCVLMPVGFAFMAVGVVYPFTVQPNSNITLNRAFLIATGVVSSTVGAILLGTGIGLRVKYNNRQSELTAGVLDSGNLGVNLKF